jgi:hypothetical protein
MTCVFAISRNMMTKISALSFIRSPSMVDLDRWKYGALLMPSAISGSKRCELAQGWISSLVRRMGIYPWLMQIHSLVHLLRALENLDTLSLGFFSCFFSRSISFLCNSSRQQGGGFWLAFCSVYSLVYTLPNKYPSVSLWGEVLVFVHQLIILKFCAGCWFLVSSKYLSLSLSWRWHKHSYRDRSIDLAIPLSEPGCT